jgi:hypothetical protein
MSRTILAALALSAFVAGCATAPPERQDNACVMMEDNRGWWKAVTRTERRWGTPPALTLAIIKQESSFRHDARPPRGDRRMLGLLPGERPSTAFGYAQALDSTWDWYRKETGNGGADRHDFDDASDFIGWYTDKTRKTNGVPFSDPASHYLAYHEGHGGFSRQTFRKKAWLMDTANRVASNTARYDSQLAGCKRSLDGRFLGIF